MLSERLVALAGWHNERVGKRQLTVDVDEELLRALDDAAGRTRRSRAVFRKAYLGALSHLESRQKRRGATAGYFFQCHLTGTLVPRFRCTASLGVEGVSAGGLTTCKRFLR